MYRSKAAAKNNITITITIIIVIIITMWAEEVAKWLRALGSNS